MYEDIFSVQIFFIIFRETLETAIIVSVLLAFIHQRFASEGGDGTSPAAVSATSLSERLKLKKKMTLQVWLGAILGLVVCFIIGAIFVTTFYFLGKDYWSYTERVWEGAFSILSSFIITVMGIGLLRINKVMKVKWWKKLGDAYNENGHAIAGSSHYEDDAAPHEGEDAADESEEAQAAVDATTTLDISEASSTTAAVAASGLGFGSSEDASEAGSTTALLNQNKQHKHNRKHKHKKQGFGSKYFLAILPFVTTLREGLEAVVFVGGIGMTSPPSTLPLSILGGIAFGATIGYILYKGGNHLSLQYFLIFSTCFLYMVSAGLMSRGVWFLELEQYVRACGGLDVTETGSGPGSYDISKSVWHVNCCNGLTDGWWMVFNAIFGWTNSATYGSVATYWTYWILVIGWLEVKLYEEREGLLPFVPVNWQLRRIKKRVKLYEARLARERTDGHGHGHSDSYHSGGHGGDGDHAREDEALLHSG